MAKDERKIKVISLDDQLKRLEENHGVPSTDAINVLTKFKTNLEEIIAEEVDAKTKNFEIQNLFGSYGLNWNEAQTRINSADGVSYEAPAYYSVSYAMPKWIVETANKNVDFSQIPSSSEISKSKKAA